MLKVAAFTQGKKVPSSRFRITQLIPKLGERDILIDELYPFVSAYPPKNVLLRPFWLAGQIGTRLPQVMSSKKFDVAIIQREFISTLPSLEFLVNPPKILDVDDAIWLHRNGLSAKSIAKSSNEVVCGNAYIADYFSNYCENITIIPTTVNIDKFVPNSKKDKAHPIIGWSGTSGGFSFFSEIERPLGDLLRRNPDWLLRIVSDTAPKFDHIPERQLEFIQWTELNEATTIQEMDIGLMPIGNSEWSRGKCSYKMLLYMACGVPVVVSDFGMNTEILKQKRVGFGVVSVEDWINSLSCLMDDERLRSELGRNGRALVEEQYSLDIGAGKWEKLLLKYR